ncbi:putative lipoprotein YbbD precursor [Actinomadura rubteroloni]|uniref:beta-N-acetylhexosaminidase n=1 Tax=Actinomadura rubteroloni TaxID=1926885 RepID=A0A2P4UPP4_9ACTN|nr:glycoside hydrolase family 3 protein [Actinomadura rubteroloni]POM27025.1 putative lipoprotein YbbD precursor [Actinomadura rubteroloni]
MRTSRCAALLAAAAVVLPLAGCDTGGSGGATSGTSAAPTPSPWIAGYLRDMSLREKVGQLFVPAFSTPAAARAMVRRYDVGGLIYFPRNMKSPAATAALSNDLQKAARTPLLLSVDEEQGIVSRAPFLTDFPGNMALGAGRSTTNAREAARVTASELRAVGINQNYAPDADVNINPANPVIGVRSFGADPKAVASLVGASVAGYQDAGVAATAKHFPGHGDTNVDSHTGLPVIRHSTTQWNRIDAPPFRAAIGAGVDAIMSAHIVVPRLDRSGKPSTLSSGVLTGMLRGRLGFQGVIITDSLLMAGVREKYGDASVPVRAIQAGADQLLMPPSLPKAFDAVLKAVQKGTISRKRLDESVTRILRLKERRGLFKGLTADPRKAQAAMRTAAHRRVATTVAEHSITLVRNDGGTLPLRRRAAFVTGPGSGPLRTALRAQGVRVVGSARMADVTVVTVFNGRPVIPGGKPAVVVALARPYALNDAGRAKAAVAAYSASGVSVKAVARVLSGKLGPTGKLPVKAAGKPIGHGLTYAAPSSP